MSDAATNNVKRGFRVTTAAIVWFDLLLQLPLTIHTSMANGMSIMGAILTYLSFLTLLTNLLVALVLPVGQDSYPVAWYW
jgi:hypothetical protein